MKKKWVKPKHQCANCGKPCSYRATYCLACANKLTKPHRHIPGKGEQHHLWKGGRIIGPHGYIQIYRPDHPRAVNHRYVLEHILVWEEARGPVPVGWVIHHLNGIKTDNRLRNLIALPSMKHSLVLAAKAKRIQELEAAVNGQAQLV